MYVQIPPESQPSPRFASRFSDIRSERPLDSLVLKECKTNIYGMLQCIPYILPENSDEYFDSIDSRLSDYELYQEDAPMLLELAIWKSKITHQFSQNAAHMRLQSRADSLSMVTIIVRNVLSFL